jgi:hypothetical protein
MERVRIGAPTAIDLDVIRSRVFGHPSGPDIRDPKWQTSPLITPRNTIRQPILANNATMLQQKIHLAALLSLIFSRPPDSRTLPFDLIAQETRLPVNEVEYLVLKAMALGLIRGNVQQDEQLVRITWIQDRAIDGEKGLIAEKETDEEEFSLTSTSSTWGRG